MTEPTDLAIVNAHVVTVDKNFSTAQAIYCKDGIIEKVGTDSEILDRIGPATTVLDLDRKTVLPGINDSHMHGAYMGCVSPPISLDLSAPGVRSIKDISDMLASAVKQKKKDEWIRGAGWNQSDLVECREDKTRFPRKSDIDVVTPDHPVALMEFSGHTLLANSNAMALAGISRDTPDPEGGQIERDPDTGDPTGIFFEPPATKMILEAMPDFSRDELRKGIESTQRRLNQYGITSFTDAALGPGGDQMFGGAMGETCIDILTELLHEGNLTLRINVLLLPGDNLAPDLTSVESSVKQLLNRVQDYPDILKIQGGKIFADGLLRSKTAFIYDEYKGGGHGILVLPGKSEAEQLAYLEQLIEIYHKNNLQIGVHVLGDRGVEATVDRMISAMEKLPGKDLRHYIIHGNMMNERIIEKMAKHGIGLSVQPEIKSISDDMVSALLGKKAAENTMPAKTCLQKGIVVSGSSDAPITVPDWRKGMMYAMLRKSKHSGETFGAHERVTIEDAIRMYTIHGAWQDRMEDKKGSIEPGKFADFCVLGEDILAAAPEEIPEIPIVKTILGGKIIYSAS